MIRASRLAALALAFGIGACGAPRLSGGDQLAYQPEDAAEVFATGWDNISEYYIDPVRVSELAVHGLQGLRQIDGDLAVSREGNELRLSRRSTVLRSFPAPADDDVARWGRVSAEIVMVGRSNSEALNSASPDNVYKTVFETAFKDLDRFSRYADRQQARENRAFREGFGGIGVVLAERDKRIEFGEVMAEGPAARAGLANGDILLTVNGEAVTGLEITAVVQKLRGRIATAVALTVLRGNRELSVTVNRAKIVPTTVAVRRDGNAIIARVSGFNQDTAVSLARQIEEMRRQIGPAFSGVILDMRGNPGGLLDQAINVADLFISEGEIISTRGRHPHSLQRYDARGDDVAAGQPVIVLINGGSASAAEVVAAALQDSGRALVLGTTSFGKGTVQTVIRLPNEGEMTLTWAKLYAPSGYALHALGVVPEICTADYAGDPAQIIADLRSGTLRPGALAAVRRAAGSQPTLPGNAPTCPRESKHGSEFDLEVARRLLADPPTLSRAREASVVAMADPTARPRRR
ncbi:MAG: S41 family peptidase [Thalassobaculales bacterium]